GDRFHQRICDSRVRHAVFPSQYQYIGRRSQSASRECEAGIGQRKAWCGARTRRLKSPQPAHEEAREVSMKIARIDQFFPRRRMRLVRITTDTGLTGWGATTLEGKP